MLCHWRAHLNPKGEKVLENCVQDYIPGAITSLSEGGSNLKTLSGCGPPVRSLEHHILCSMSLCISQV